MTTAPNRTAPAWVQETVPTWVEPYRGAPGLPAPCEAQQGPLATTVAGVDYWQANYFVAYQPETADYLYGAYTPLQVDYQRGTLPAYEQAVAPYVHEHTSARDLALALVRAVPLHPVIPPCGPKVPTDLNLSDEQLLAAECAWCNEQSRVYVRLCQVAGIPARMVFLFYDDGNSGHVVAEFYADGQWSMIDQSWVAFGRGADGRILSAAECHDGGENQQRAREGYRARYRELLAMSDAELRLDVKPDARQWLEAHAGGKERDFGCFGVLNYPLPPAS
ncbi:MAG: transglutaminase domain-containing protein [Phycisphaeraceae bacterium]